jgi:hypothetical protein
MDRSNGGWRFGLAIPFVAIALCGCGVPAGTGGGGDPLAQYRLDGSDPELEGNVTAINARYNEALGCVEADQQLTDEQQLAVLLDAYARIAPPETFDQFVEGMVSFSEQRTAEICDTELSDDAEVAGLADALVAESARQAACLGVESQVTQETALVEMKKAWLATIGNTVGSLAEAGQHFLALLTLSGDSLCETP